jgi:hypothetical protein
VRKVRRLIMCNVDLIVTRDFLLTRSIIHPVPSSLIAHGRTSCSLFLFPYTARPRVRNLSSSTFSFCSVNGEETLQHEAPGWKARAALLSLAAVGSGAHFPLRLRWERRQRAAPTRGSEALGYRAGPWRPCRGERWCRTMKLHAWR